MRSLLLSSFLLMYFFQLHAKKIVVYNFDKIENISISEEEIQIIKEWRKLQPNKVGDATFLFEDNDIYAFENCQLGLWKWGNNNWINIYGQRNGGPTCSADIYHLNKNFYLIGGYGFWQGQGLALIFDPQFKEWNLLANNEPEEALDYLPALTYFRKEDSSFYMLYGQHINEKIDKEELEINGYCINKARWQKLDATISNEFDTKQLKPKEPIKADLQDYAVIYNYQTNKKGWYVIQKSTNKIFFIPQYIRFEEFNRPYALVQFENTLQIIQKEVIEIQFNESKISMGSEIGQVEKTGQNWLLYLIIFGGLIIISFGSHKFYKKGIQQEKRDPYYALIQSLDKKSFTTEELDELFGLDHIENYDTRRGKRAKIIGQINDIHQVNKNKDLLIRVKNNEDKRYLSTFEMIK